MSNILFHFHGGRKEALVDHALDQTWKARQNDRARALELGRPVSVPTLPLNNWQVP